METISHTISNCACGHDDEMHVIGARFRDDAGGIVCRVCNMERDVFPVKFLNDERHRAVYRAFLVDHLKLADEADDTSFDSACRIAYLKLSKMQRDDFDSAWRAHIAALG
jgi:hypothetical protein